MTAIAFCAIALGGFAIGFVCWKGAFVAVNPLASALFDLESLEPIGVKIVRAVVFAFLVCLTSALLLVYPICFHIFASAPMPPHLSAALSFAASFLGCLCLLYMRRIADRAIRLSRKINSRRQTGRL